MAASEPSAITVVEVDHEISRGASNLRFSRSIERLFLEDYLFNRARMVTIWALVGTLMYCMALAGDFSMVPDVAPIMLFLRLGVFVPFALLVILVMRLRPTARNYDMLSFGVGVLGIALPMVTLIFASGPYLFIYQTGSVGTLAFFVIVLRPRFRTVILGLGVMTAIQLTTIHINGNFDEVRYGGIVTFYITLVVFLALSAYFHENMDRMNFLHRLRGELLQEELRVQSEQDVMSGLLNRRSLSRYERELWAADSTSTVVSAIMIDIDLFKSYNDSHGHLAGDACIMAVSQIVRGTVGACGKAFRFGGEELLVLLPGIYAERAAEFAEQMRVDIEAAGIHHRGKGIGGTVTASFGVAEVLMQESSFQMLLQAADTALYDAKKAGRNTVKVWGANSAEIRELRNQTKA